MVDKKEITGHIIHRDAFDVLPTLDSNSVNMILTDPPYDFSGPQIQWLHKEFLRICSGVIIVFAPPENQWVLPADQYGFWTKPISTKNTSRKYSRFVEMIFIYGNNVWNSKRHWSQYVNIFNDRVDSTKVHPFRKPPSLMEKFILNHTSPGDIILDPFSGSGVVGDMARQHHRKCISIEIESKYRTLDDII